MTSTHPWQLSKRHRCRFRDFLTRFDDIDFGDRDPRLSERFEIHPGQLRDHRVVDGSPAKALGDLDTGPEGAPCGRHSVHDAPELAFLCRRGIQPSPRLTILQRHRPPPRVRTHIELLVIQLRPAVLLNPPPELSLLVDQALQVFAVRADPDQTSHSPVEGPVVRLFGAGYLKLVLQLTVIVRRYAVLLGSIQVTDAQRTLDFEHGRTVEAQSVQRSAHPLELVV